MLDWCGTVLAIIQALRDILMERMKAQLVGVELGNPGNP